MKNWILFTSLIFSKFSNSQEIVFRAQKNNLGAFPKIYFLLAADPGSGQQAGTANIYGNIQIRGYVPNADKVGNDDFFYVYTREQIDAKIKELNDKNNAQVDSIHNLRSYFNSTFYTFDSTINNTLIKSISDIGLQLFKEDVFEKFKTEILESIKLDMEKLRLDIQKQIDSLNKKEN